MESIEKESATLKDEMERKLFLTVKINNVPPKFWEEFKMDAEENFANNYIMKIMSDHMKSRASVHPDLLVILADLGSRLASLEERYIGTTQEAEKKAINVIRGFGRKEE